MVRPVANPKTKQSKDQHKLETITAPILVIFPSLRERLNNSNKTNSLYTVKKATRDSLTSKNMLLPLQPPPSILFPRISNASSESTFPLRGLVTSSFQWCPTSGGRGDWVTKVSRLSCQHRFHVLSRVCEGLGWNAWRLQDTVWGRSRSDLFMPFSLHFLPLCASAFCLHVRLVALFSIRPVHPAHIIHVGMQTS